MGSLAGKRALVVGVTGRHAAAVVRALRAQSAIVALVDDYEEALQPLAEETGAELALRCDMTEPGIVATIADLASRGPIDILVTCPPAIAETPDPAAEAGHLAKVMATTLEPVSRWTSAAQSVMRSRGSGVIVHVTGLPGLGGWRGWSSAGAAFAGIHSLVKTSALELAAQGVRVNALVPGITPALASVLATHTGQSIDAIRARIPLNALMSEDAFGNALVYLVHPSSSYVTGEILAVDGGWDIWGRLHAVAAS